MENKDEQLWKIAKKRAEFKKGLFAYGVVIPFLWGIWWLTLGKYLHGNIINVTTWPVYVMLGWGLGLCFQYFNAYGAGSQDMVEREFEKLKREREST